MRFPARSREPAPLAPFGYIFLSCGRRRSKSLAMNCARSNVPVADGTTIYAPCGTFYRGLWPRDYEYVVEGAGDILKCQLPGYTASAALPLAGIRAMLQRRAKTAADAK